MSRIRNNVLPRNIVTVLTAFALLVSFSLSALESQDSVWTDRGDKFFFQYRPVEPALITESDNSRISFLRMAIQKFFAPWGIGGNIFCPWQFRAYSKDFHVNIENNIRLKLLT